MLNNERKKIVKYYTKVGRLKDILFKFDLVQSTVSIIIHVYKNEGRDELLKIICGNIVKQMETIVKQMENIVN